LHYQQEDECKIKKWHYKRKKEEREQIVQASHCRTECIPSFHCLQHVAPLTPTSPAKFGKIQTQKILPTAAGF
jgi:hypothetical protein